MSFRLKTILGIALIEFVLLVAMILSSLDYLISSNQKEFKRRADLTAKLLATASVDAVLSTDLSRLNRLVSDFMYNSELVYLRIRDTERVLVEAGDEEALNSPFQIDDTLEDTRDGIYDVSASIQKDGLEYGQVQLGLSIHSTQAIVESASQRIVGLALLEMTLVALFSWLLGSYLTRQLAELEMAANLIVQGNDAPRLKVRGKDELTKVTLAFNSMSESVQISHAQLLLYLSEVNNQREWLMTLIDSGLDGLIAINKQGQITLFNRMAEKLFGYQAEEVLGRNVNILMPEPYQSAHDDYLANYLKTGIKGVIGFSRELVGQRKDSSIFSMELSVTEFNSAKENGFIGIVRDITEQKLLNDTLRSSESMKKSILEASLDAIVNFDEHGWIVEFNPSASCIFGYSSDEIVGRLPIESLIPQRYKVAHIFNQRIELTALRKSGEEFPIEIAITPITMNQQLLFTAFIRDISESKRAETRINALNAELEKQNQHLLDSEAKLNKAQEVAAVGSWYLDVSSGELTWSDQAYKIFGVSIGTPIGLNKFVEFLHPDDRDKVLSVWDAALKGAPYDIEHRIWSQGQIKWVRNRAEIKYSEDHQALEAIGTVQDITERKLLEEMLKLESEKNQVLLHNASDGIHILDLDGNVVEASDAFYTMLGYSREEMIGMNVASWDGMFQKTELLQIIQNQFQDQQRVQFETVHFRKNGSRFPVEISGFPLPFKGQSLMFYSSRDITRRKELDDELRASENMKQAILESSLDGVIRIDAQERIVEFNRSASAIFGYSSDEAIGKQMGKLLFKTEFAISLKQCIDVFNEAGLCEKMGQHHEIFALRKSGEEFPLEITMIPISLSRKQFFVAFVRDLSDSKRVEDALRHGREQAEQASQMKSQFLAIMSHEIRTPLNAILGAHELLADTPLDQIQSDYLGLANDAGNTLVTLVSDILDFSKIKANKLELENCPFDSLKVVNEVLKLLNIKAREKKLALNCCIEEGIETVVNGDPLRFRQVVLNLVSNAIKFTETGGVTLKLSKHPKSKNRNMLLLEVIDTGIGIAEIVQPSLFESFIQADASDTRKFGGTGLGLVICKRLVGLWGGEIGLDSQLGTGSRFWFTFGEPVDNSQLTDMDQNPAQNPSRSSNTKARVLLVEDSVINQVVISALLRNAGHQVDVVDSGAAAIAAVKQQSYDLVFMDVSMPDMTGMDATRAIRQLQGNAGSVPIVAMTAHAFKLYQEQCLAAGMNDYATKPISKNRLLDLIDRWCGNQSARLPQQSDYEQPAESDLLLDEAILNSLTEEAELEDITPLLQIFIAELENRHQDIARAIENQDIGKLGLAAHSLKSAAATFGAKPLNALAVSTDNCCQKGDLVGALQEAKKLLACAKITLTKLHQRCQS